MTQLTAALRQAANKFVAFDGAVTFWLIGYRTLQTDQCIRRLEAIEPQFEYFNEETGVVVRTEPEEYRKAQEAFEATKIEMPSGWLRRRLWETEHDIFWLCVPLTVDIEFKLTPKSAVAAKALASYWQVANGNVPDNWQLFRQLLPVQALTTWLQAYDATRDTDMAAPEALQQGEPDKSADPLDGSDGTTNNSA